MYQAILHEKRSKVRHLPDLPPFPAVGQQILKHVTSEQVDIPRLAKTIERDPAVFARIIGVANSAFYGCRDTVYTINQAIVRVLGLNIVKSLALGIVLNNPFRVADCPSFDMREYWYRSMHTALISQAIARIGFRRHRPVQEQAYLAGMLSHIGELVLAYLFPSEMSDVIRRMNLEQDIDEQQLQQDIVGVSSQEVSILLAQRWHLPSGLLNLYRNMHDVDYTGEDAELVNLVCFSQRLSANKEAQEGIETDKAAAYIKLLNLDHQHIEKLMARLPQIQNEVSQLASVLAKA